MTSDNRRVFSTEDGWMDAQRRRDRKACTRRAPMRLPQGDGPVRLSREVKGRKGKGVTVVTGLPLPADELADLARQLKQMCGSGGTVKNGVVEIQGDHRDRLAAELKRRGYAVKRAGG